MCSADPNQQWQGLSPTFGEGSFEAWMELDRLALLNVDMSLSARDEMERLALVEETAKGKNTARWVDLPNVEGGDRSEDVRLAPGPGSFVPHSTQRLQWIIQHDESVQKIA